MAMTPAQEAKMMDGILAQLSEHFDAVQILASRPVPINKTRSVYKGIGNWYARQGMAHEFIEEDQAQTNAREIAKVLDPPTTDGELWKQP